jgi:hypothetical protein
VFTNVLVRGIPPDLKSLKVSKVSIIILNMKFIKIK